MKSKNPFDVLNELKTHATYLEGLAIIPNTHPDFVRKMEQAAKVMRKAARVIEMNEDDFIPDFIRARA